LSARRALANRQTKLEDSAGNPWRRETSTQRSRSSPQTTSRE
jgi:hypothetical protein